MTPKLKAFLTRLVTLVASLMMTCCHVVYSGPALWRQGSSTAFDAMVGIGIFCAVAVFIATIDIFKGD